MLWGFFNYLNVSFWHFKAKKYHSCVWNNLLFQSVTYSDSYAYCLLNGLNKKMKYCEITEENTKPRKSL